MRPASGYYQKRRALFWRGLRHPNTPLSDLLACPSSASLAVSLLLSLSLSLAFTSSCLTAVRPIRASNVFSRAVNLEWRYENRAGPNGDWMERRFSKRLPDVSWRQRRRPPGMPCRSARSTIEGVSRDYTRNFIRVPRSLRFWPSSDGERACRLWHFRLLYHSEIIREIWFSMRR